MYGPGYVVRILATADGLKEMFLLRCTMACRDILCMQQILVLLMLLYAIYNLGHGFLSIAKENKLLLHHGFLPTNLQTPQFT